MSNRMVEVMPAAESAADLNLDTIDRNSSSASISSQALKSPIHNLMALKESKNISNELNTPTKDYKSSDMNVSPADSDVSSHDHDEVIELTKDTVAEKIKINIDLNFRIGESKVKDSMNEIFNIFKELSTNIIVTNNGYELLLNQVMFRFIKENINEFNSIVKLIGHFRETLHKYATIYAKSSYNQIDKTIYDSSVNKREKTFIRNQKVLKLRAFDRLIFYYFYLIIIRYNKEFGTSLINKIKVKHHFCQDFDNNFNLIKNLIQPNDISFITILLEEFVGRKKEKNLTLGFHKKYQNLFLKILTHLRSQVPHIPNCSSFLSTA